MGSVRIKPLVWFGLLVAAVGIVPDLKYRSTPLRARDAGRGTILECSRTDIRRCRVALYGVNPAELNSLTAQDQIQFFMSGRLVYAASQVRVLRTFQDHGKDVGTLVATSGPWLVSVRKPQFYTHGAYAAAYVIERASAGLDWEDPNLFHKHPSKQQNAHNLVVNDGDHDDALFAAPASEGATSRPRTAPPRRREANPPPPVLIVPQPTAAAQPAPPPAPTFNIVNNIGASGSSSSNGSGASATAGADDYVHPRVALRAQLGTPNSPTGMYGLGLDVYFANANVPLSIGYGAYDSRLFMDPSRGSVRYQTTSIGSAFVLGHKAAQLRVGGDLVRTHAAITPGGADPKGTPISEDHRASHTYLGFVPSLGLSIATDEHAFIILSVGQYMSVSGAFKGDPGATYTPISNSSNPNQVRNSTTTANLGFGYNF